MKMKIKDIVKNNVVRFSHYRAKILYYNVDVDGVTYMFPVPIEGVDNATMLNEDKAMIMMRFIRKSLDEGSFVKA